jgi:hypothetical protein
MAAGNLVAAIFASRQCETMEAQDLLFIRLDEWLQERPDIARDIVT